MAVLDETAIINKLATHAGAITGVTNAYSFAANPDNLTSAMLPAIMFYPPQFSYGLRAHHNRWQTEITIVGALFVAERESRGGKLKFLENEAMPFGKLFRVKFGTESVISDLLSLGATTAFLTKGVYGAGLPALTVNGKPYIGWVFEWNFIGTN